MPRLATSRRQAAGCAPLPSAHTGSRYARHAPERTLLYALVEAHYPDFIARIEAEGRSLPGYVREAFDAYLRCGVLEHGFLRVVCEHCRAERLVAFSCKKRGFCPSCGARRMAESARHLVEEVFGPRPVRQWVLSFPYPLRFLFASKPEAIGPVLGIVQRVIAGWLADQAGIDRASAQCGAVTLIQRFGSALNLNIHFHMLWLDGVYVEATELPRRELRLHRARAPTTAQLTQLAATIAHRVCRHLTRKGWLEGEGESAFLADSAAGDDSMDGLRMSSITYRIATGRDAGCKVVTLQTLPGDAGSLEGEAGKVGGFSLHAGVAAEAHESHKLEKLCRYKSLAFAGADQGAKDCARVLRLCGTINAKNGATVQGQVYDPEPWNFHSLCDEILGPRPEPKSKAKVRDLATAKAERGQRIRTGSIYDWWHLVYRDLLAIAERHWFGGIPKGHRNNFLFLSSVALSWFAHPETMEAELTRRAQTWSWTQGLGASEVRAAIAGPLKRAQRAAAGETVLYDGEERDPRYWYKRETLYGLMKPLIDDDLAPQLRAIVSDEIRREHKRETNRKHEATRDRVAEGRYALKRDEYQGTAEQRRATARILRAQGKSWAEVAAEVGYKNADAARKSCA